VVGARQKFAHQTNAQEAEYGFSAVERQTGEVIVRYDLGNGIFAIKVDAEDGSLEYMICDANLTPLYRPAKSLDELRARFGHSKSGPPIE
jgi:hypothetical protein